MKNDNPSIHLDLFGRELKLDDIVAFPESNTMSIGKIVKINPKMIKLTAIKKAWRKDKLIYANQCILLDGQEVTMYLLRNS